MSMTGSKIKPTYSPAHRKEGRKVNNGKRGLIHPFLRHFGSALAHRVMAATYAVEPCPIFFDSKGNPYKGIVHHVIENPYDLRVDNLLWWLSYKEHHIADVRRRKLEQILPDMYAVPTVELKRLQDPRRVDEWTFNVELQKLAETYGTQDHL